LKNLFKKCIKPQGFPHIYRLFVLFPLLWGLAIPARADVTPECRKAYNLIWQYRLAEAEPIIIKQQKAHPADPFPVYLQSLSHFFKAFITEDAKSFSRFKTDEDTWLNKLDDCDTKNPYTLFARGEIHLHGAMLRLKMAENFGGAKELNSSYNRLIECTKKFPDFLPAQKDLLFMKAAIGTVPEGYKWLLNILGFSGDLNKSMQAYSGLVKKMTASSEYGLFLSETQILYGYLTYYLLNKPEDAWASMSAGTRDYAKSQLYAFVRANLAMRLKKTDLALEALKPHTGKPPTLYHMDYLYGSAKLQHGDADASVYLARFLRNYTGKSFIKDGYLRLAWAFLLKGDTKNYYNSLELVRSYGQTHLEDDKSALLEAQRKTLPPITLLRARLYYDGGYFQKASEVLASVKEAAFNEQYDKAEYHYRYCRVLEALNQTDKAVTEYNTVINQYSNIKVHFAPASCLYIGLISEKKGEKQKAITYFKKCLAYKDYNYKNSFDQKANAGLRRLGE
jgi:hypothetical protein